MAGFRYNLRHVRFHDNLVFEEEEPQTKSSDSLDSDEANEDPEEPVAPVGAPLIVDWWENESEMGSTGDNYDPSRPPRLAEMGARMVKNFRQDFEAYATVTLGRGLPMDANTGEVVVPQRRQFSVVQSCLARESAAAAWMDGAKAGLEEAEVREGAISNIMDLFWEALQEASAEVSPAELTSFRNATVKKGESPELFGLRLRSLWVPAKEVVPESEAINHFLGCIGASEALQAIVDAMPRDQRSFVGVVDKAHQAWLHAQLRAVSASSKAGLTKATEYGERGSSSHEHGEDEGRRRAPRPRREERHGHALSAQGMEAEQGMATSLASAIAQLTQMVEKLGKLPNQQPQPQQQQLPPPRPQQYAPRVWDDRGPQCYSCGRYGHIARSCTVRPSEPSRYYGSNRYGPGPQDRFQRRPEGQQQGAPAPRDQGPPPGYNQAAAAAREQAGPSAQQGRQAHVANSERENEAQGWAHAITKDSSQQAEQPNTRFKRMNRGHMPMSFLPAEPPKGFPVAGGPQLPEQSHDTATQEACEAHLMLDLGALQKMSEKLGYQVVVDKRSLTMGGPSRRATVAAEASQDSPLPGTTRREGEATTAAKETGTRILTVYDWEELSEGGEVGQPWPPASNAEPSPSAATPPSKKGKDSWDSAASLLAGAYLRPEEPLSVAELAEAVPPTLESFNSKRGTLHYATNRSAAQGISLLLESGQALLPKLLLDTGADTNLVSEDFCHRNGLKYEPCTLVINMASGAASPVLGKVTEPVRLCYAKGTAAEVSNPITLYVIKGKVSSFEVLVGAPEMRTHGAMVDPIYSLCNYRPGWQACGDASWTATVPVTITSAGQSVMAATEHRTVCSSGLTSGHATVMLVLAEATPSCASNSAQILPELIPSGGSQLAGPPPMDLRHEAAEKQKSEVTPRERRGCEGAQQASRKQGGQPLTSADMLNPKQMAASARGLARKPGGHPARRNLRGPRHAWQRPRRRGTTKKGAVPRQPAPDKAGHRKGGGRETRPHVGPEHPWPTADRTHIVGAGRASSQGQ